MDHAWALLPAAGKGSRMGGPRKQFRELGRGSLLLHTARAFAHHDRVGGLVIGCPSEVVTDLEREVEQADLSCKVEIVAGGATRQETVLRLVEVCPANDCTGVLVHDAVRPFVSQELLTRVIDAVDHFDAAAPAVGVRDTLRKKEGAWFGDTVPRRTMVRMQTPQGFRKRLLLRAHENAEDNEATDDVELVQQYGHRVRLVRGDSFNFKVTTPDDWKMAQALWPWWKKQERVGW